MLMLFFLIAVDASASAETLLSTEELLGLSAVAAVAAAAVSFSKAAAEMRSASQ